MRGIEERERNGDGLAIRAKDDGSGISLQDGFKRGTYPGKTA